MKEKIIALFNNNATLYDEAAFLPKEMGLRLLEQATTIEHNPQFILDLGGGTGFFTKALQAQYPNACVFNVDLSFAMLKTSMRNTNFNHPSPFAICADAEQLPIQSNSIDFVFANCAFPWFLNATSALEDLQRVLKPNGVLLFSTFGPDTLIELQTTYAINASTPFIEKHPFHPFIDMHHWGDLIVKMKGFKNPVMMTECVNMQYAEMQQLFLDLDRIGLSLFIDPSFPIPEPFSNNFSFEMVFGFAKRY